MKKALIFALFVIFSSFKTALITGGAGFIGSHLTEKLLEEGLHVICLDDLSSGRMKNVLPFLSHPNYRFIQGDVRDFSLPEEPFDLIFNLASPASPEHYLQNPIKTLLTNVEGAKNLAELARKTGAILFQASTSEVYGDPLVHPQVEEDWGHVNPIGPRACYDEGKRAAEALLFDYRRLYGIRLKVARIFNTYGPRMSPQDGRVIVNFALAALKNLPLTLYGTGEKTRSFCYIDDLVRGILAFIETDDEETGPINLGNPEEVKLIDLARLTLELTHSSSPILFLPPRVDDPVRRCPNIEKAKSRLNWEPRIPLREGLKKTIDYLSIDS